MGLSKNAAYMMSKLDNSSCEFASVVKEINEINLSWDKSIFKRSDLTMERIMNILTSMSGDSICTAICSEESNHT